MDLGRTYKNDLRLASSYLSQLLISLILLIMHAINLFQNINSIHTCVPHAPLVMFRVILTHRVIFNSLVL